MAVGSQEGSCELRAEAVTYVFHLLKRRDQSEAGASVQSIGESAITDDLGECAQYSELERSLPDSVCIRLV